MAPAAPPPASAPPHHHSMTIDKVRTIFISELPQDVKERELVNLLRWLPGYEASQHNFKGELPMGFALFYNHQCAISAKDAIQGLVFDMEGKCILHTEMTKKNLFVKRDEIRVRSCSLWCYRMACSLLVMGVGGQRWGFRGEAVGRLLNRTTGLVGTGGGLMG